MWRLVLTVSLLCCSSEGKVSCRDENNGEVDWYILYKTPRNQNKKLDGLDYVYIYPDVNDNNKAKLQEKNKEINNATGVLANTLQPLFKFDKNNPPSDFGYISYSDQPPDYLNKSVSSSYGHSKGVVMVEKNNKGGTGVWLLHSTPQFPYGRKPDKFWPKSGARNGQTFICVTFNYDQFEHIGKHLQYIKAYPFDSYIPSDFHDMLRNVTTKNTTIHSTPVRNRFDPPFQPLRSNKGNQFGCIAKQVSADGKGKPGNGDLYVTISEKINSDVDVQSWGCQPDRDDSFCSGTKKVQNVLFVKTDLGKWDSGSDHSKWCVVSKPDQNKDWTCIADVNRSVSQYNRLGGALCIKDLEVAKIFKGFAEYVDECPVLSGSKRKHVSSSSSNSG